ncbi:DUF3977 family protein [Heyndrickxia oleronia]
MDSEEGFKKTKKRRRAFKFIFGICSH